MILPIGGIALLASPQVPAAKGPRPDVKSQRKPTLKLSVSCAQQDTSTAIAVTDPPLEMTTGVTGLAETLIEERDSNTGLPVPAGQSTCSDNSPTGTSEVGENVSSCDEDKSSDSPAFDDSGGNLQTAVESERNCIDVEPNSGTTDEIDGDDIRMNAGDGSSGVLVVEEPCPESSCCGSETQSESEEGSISGPHSQDSEEDAGSLQNHPSRPTRTRLPPKRYTFWVSLLPELYRLRYRVVGFQSFVDHFSPPQADVVISGRYNIFRKGGL